MRLLLLASIAAAGALLAGSGRAAAPLVAAAAPPAPMPVELLPGVTVTKTVEFTPHGAVGMTVITGPKPGGLYALAPAVARGTLTGGLERVTQIEKDVSAQATVVGIDGDAFDATTGEPSGLLIQGGVLQHPPVASRSSVGVDGTGQLTVGRVRFLGTWRGTGPRRTLGALNQPPATGQVVLYTPAYGPRAPVLAGAVQVVLEPFPPAVPNSDLSGTVTAVGVGGGTPIPADGAVLLATGTAATNLEAEAAVGTTIVCRLILQPAWSGVVAAIGGGPALLADGKPIFRSGEDFPNAFLGARTARAAVGQLADGSIVLVTVDGDQPGYSVGLTNYELAQTMLSLGAVTASALDGGDSTTAAFDGQLLNRPSARGGERAVKEALLLEYYGVYAAPPPIPVVTGDAGLAAESLSYKIVRPSTVTAQLVAPDGTATTIDSGQKPAGSYAFAESTFTSEGTWHWLIAATDDLGRASTIDRTFRVDGTLRRLTAPRAAQGTATFHFTLSRSAAVVLQIETPAGVLIRALPAQQLPAGAAAVTWDGLLPGGSPAYGGSYVAHLTVTSSVGTSELSTPFAFRR